MENVFIKTKIYMMVSGKKIYLMDKESIHIGIQP
jgi:hypothetical protein